MQGKSTRAVIAAVVTAAVLAVPTIASAQIHDALEHAGAAAAYGYDLGAHAKHTQRTRKTVAIPTTNPTQNPTPPASYGQPTDTGIRYLEAGDEGACANNVNPVPFLQAHQATVMRFGIQPSFLTTDQGLQCVNMARAAGYKIYLTVAFNASAPPAQVAAYVAQVISVYGPAWAISFGNEETLTNNWVPNPVSETADAYYAMWQAVEPTIAADDPGAIRVLADASPWDAGWLERLVSDHPVGAMAAAFHCYNSNAGGLQDVPELAAAMATAGLPLWCSEMAPQTIEPTGSAAGAFVTQTVGQYDAQVAQAAAASPDLAMVSFYEWPSIGAVTPGIAS